MAQPRAVKKMAKTAAKLQEKLNTDPEKAGEEKPPVDPVTPAVPAQSVNKAPEAVASPEKPVDPPPAAPNEGNWKERFSGMKRLHDENVIAFKEQNVVRDQEVSDLRGQITELREQISSIDIPAETPPAETIEVTPEEIEEYGQPLVDLISRVAKGSGDPAKDLAKQVLDQKTRLENLEQGQKAIVENTVVNSKQTFAVRLSELVPDWRQVNDDESFQNWLSEEVPYTGKERQQFLEEAHETLDVDKVAKFFTDWKASTGAPALPDAQPTPTVIPDNAHNTVVETAVETVQGKIWKKSEIDRFYRDKREGKYNGSQDSLKEARRIEKDILAAPREGRIRKG